MKDVIVGAVLFLFQIAMFSIAGLSIVNKKNIASYKPDCAFIFCVLPQQKEVYEQPKSLPRNTPNLRQGRGVTHQ